MVTPMETVSRFGGALAVA